MPIYEEKSPKLLFAILLLSVAFFIIYSPFQLGDRELFWRECEYAAIASDINLLEPVSSAHGEILPLYPPAYPWIVSLVSISGLKMEFCLRIVSVFSLFALAVIVWEACRRAIGTEAACTGAAMMISTGIIMEKAVNGYPSMLGLLFLTSAWLSWYNFGVARSKWNKGWFYSFFFCGLSFFTLGWYGIIYFVLPLIFMRRPMTVWRKLKWPGLYIGLFLLVIFLSYWSITVSKGVTFYNIKTFSLSSYLKHLLSFPFELILRFMPWSLIAWAPFCVAFHPLEKRPIFCRFLRIITISLFFLLWFNPYTNSRDQLILVPPVAILTGLNYWIIVRRYGDKLHQILQIFSYIITILSIFIVIFYLSPAEIWKDLQNIFSLSKGISFKETNMTSGIVQGCTAIVISFSMILLGSKSRVWERTLLICCCFMLFFWSILNPYKAQDNSEKQFGLKLQEALKKAITKTQEEGIPIDDFSKDTILYKDKMIAGLYGECYYLGCKVKKIRSQNDLKRVDKCIFLISTGSPYSGREWDNLLPLNTEYKGIPIYLRRGIIKESPKNE